MHVLEKLKGKKRTNIALISEDSTGMIRAVEVISTISPQFQILSLEPWDKKRAFDH